MTGPVQRLAGMDIYVTDFPLEQWRFPTTKKRRIRNKWAKRRENLRRPSKCYIIHGQIFCSPDQEAALQRAIKEQKESWKPPTQPNSPKSKYWRDAACAAEGPSLDLPKSGSDTPSTSQWEMVRWITPAPPNPLDPRLTS